MDDMELYRRLGLALAIGLMLGVERGWQLRDKAEGSRIAGIRSFTLMGLLGGLWGVIGLESSELVTGIAFLGFTSLIVTAHILRLRKDPDDLGITTEISEMLTFALGVVAARGHLAAAAAGGVVTLALLSFKQALHHFVSSIRSVELVAAVRFLIISVVMLPVLPDQGYGPGEALNPYKMWWVVVLIAAISFVGYIAIKLAGPRIGALLTGFFGGLASSTALTVNFARLGREQPGLQPVLAAGVCVAAATMFLRILLIVFVLTPALLPPLAMSMGVMAAVCYLGAAVLWMGSREQGPKAQATKLSNPFELGTAIKFALFLTAVLLLSKLLQENFGNQGVLVLGGVSGLADVDAIAVSMARMAKTGLGLDTAAAAVTLAAFVNTLVKGGMVIGMCGGGMAKRVGAVFALTCLAGGAALIFA